MDQRRPYTPHHTPSRKVLLCLTAFRVGHSGLAVVPDRLAIPIYCKGPTATTAEIAEALAMAGPDAKLSFILRPGWPTLEGPEALAAAVEAARRADAEAVDFYNYGHLRLSSLDWIGIQAL